MRKTEAILLWHLIHLMEKQWNVEKNRIPDINMMKEILFLNYYAAKKTRTSTGDTPTSPSSWRVCHSAMTAKPTISLYF